MRKVQGVTRINPAAAVVALAFALLGVLLLYGYYRTPKNIALYAALAFFGCAALVLLLPFGKFLGLFGIASGLGAIFGDYHNVGSVVGGVLFVAAGIALLFWKDDRQQARKRDRDDADSSNDPSGLDGDAGSGDGDSTSD